MINIKIYGTGTPTYQLAKAKMEERLSAAGIEYSLAEVTQVADIMHDKVESVPAIRVNDEHLFEIKPNGSYNQSLRDAIQNIMKVEDYGKMVRIMVPTDFSDPSYNAYNFADSLAKHVNGVIMMTHVYYPTSTDVNQFVVMNEEAEKIHKEKLEDLVKSLNKDWIGSFVSEPMVEGVFRVGFPKMELTEMSKTPNTMMVMGTTGSGDTFKKVFGSLSLDMIDDCYCPLFLVPPGAVYSKMEEMVFLSEDLKNDTNHLLFAGRLCSKLGTEFRLIHYRIRPDDEYDVSDTIKIMENYFPELKYHIEVIDTSDLFDNIKTLVQEGDNKIVVMATKHRNIFQSIFHKSVTEFAALNSRAPLLILSDLTHEEMA
jgi:nucleotide-binding universal stress UspA family protein